LFIHSVSAKLLEQRINVKFLVKLKILLTFIKFCSISLEREQ